MKHVVFVGNCQISALAKLYSRFVAFNDTIVVDVVDISRIEEGRYLINQADVVVEQVFDFGTRLKDNEIPVAAERFLVPVTSATFLWPFSGRPHPQNKRFPFLGAGPYDGENGDTHLNRLIAANVDPDQALNDYLGLDVNSKVNLDRLFELAIEGQKKRDVKAGFEIADLTEAFYQDEKIFLTPYHPNLRIFTALVQQLFTKMAVPGSVIDMMIQSLNVTPFPPSCLPIHPAVVDHFKLKWVIPDQRYPFLSEGEYTFADYVRRYVVFGWNQDLQEGIWLSGRDGGREAMPVLMKGLAASPQSVLGHRVRSSLLAGRGLLRAALASARAAAGIDPSDPHSQVNLGHRLAGMGLVDQAEAAFRRAVSLDPYLTIASVQLALFLRNVGRVEDALPVLEAAIRLAPGDLSLRTCLVETLTTMLRMNEAEEACHAALAVSSSQPLFYTALADVFGRQGRWDEATAVLNQAKEINPGDAATHAHLAQVHIRLGQVEEAEACYRDAIARSPSPNTFKPQLIDVLIRQGRLEQALQVNQEMLAAEPQSPQHRVREGSILARMKRFDEAEVAIRAGIALGPGLASARSDLADLLSQRNRFDEASAEVAEALRIDPRNPHYFARRGQVFSRKGDLAGAEEAYRQAVAIEPAIPEFKAALFNILVHQNKATDEVLRLCKELAKHFPNNPEFRSMLMRLQTSRDAAQAPVHAMTG